MLLFIYGEQRQKALEALEEEKEKFLKTNPSGAIISVIGDDASEDTLTALSEETELFGAKQLVVLSGWCEDATAKEYLIENLSILSKSKKLFIIFENTIDVRLAKKIEKEADATRVFENGAKGRGEEFNIFTLANALGERDKKKLWILLTHALEHGVAPEEIHGTLFWQVKAILLAKDVEEGRERNSGLNPFVLRNATRYAKNFTTEELTKLSQELVDTYHRAHQGETEFSHALERFALNI